MDSTTSRGFIYNSLKRVWEIKCTWIQVCYIHMMFCLSSEQKREGFDYACVWEVCDSRWNFEALHGTERATSPCVLLYVASLYSQHLVNCSSWNHLKIRKKLQKKLSLQFRHLKEWNNNIYLQWSMETEGILEDHFHGHSCDMWWCKKALCRRALTC